MLFGPIFSVELVTTARRARHLVLRVLCAAFLGAVLVMAYREHFPDTPGAVVQISRIADFASGFFSYFAFTQLIVMLLVTPALTAGTISLERERRTIEYLFATDLSNHEIVLGKLAARLVVTLCLAIAGLPILSIAMLLGGIEPQRLYMAMAITFSTTLGLAALGIGVSVATKRSRDAVVRTYGLLAVMVILPPIVSVMLMAGTTPVAVREWLVPLTDELLVANPMVAMTRLFAPWTVTQDWGLTLKLALYHGALGVACLVPAVATVRRRHLKSFEVPSKEKGRSGRSRRRIGQWPLLWKEMYVGRTRSQNAWTTRLAMLLIVGTVAALTVWMAVYTAQYAGVTLGQERLVEIYLMSAAPLAALLACLGMLVLASWSAASITSEKERDTWASLLCTPLTPKEIIAGKIVGNLYATRWLLVLPLIVYAPAVFFSPDFVLALPFILGTQLVLCTFVTTMGVLFSLKSRNTLRAMGGTLAVAFVVGGGYLMCCCMPLSIGGSLGGLNEFITWTPCMPYLLVAPVIFYESFQSDYVSRADPEMLWAYILGTSGYAVGAIVLFFVTTANFEQFSGRSTTTGTYYRGMSTPRPTFGDQA